MQKANGRERGSVRAHSYLWSLSSPQQPLETEDSPTVSSCPEIYIATLVPRKTKSSEPTRFWFLRASRWLRKKSTTDRSEFRSKRCRFSPDFKCTNFIGAGALTLTNSLPNNSRKIICKSLNFVLI